MVKPETADVILYTRAGCHLCDAAKEELDRLRAKADFRLQVVDIDSDSELREKFNEEVPVVFIHGRKAFKYRVEPGEFLKRLRGRR